MARTTLLGRVEEGEDGISSSPNRLQARRRRHHHKTRTGCTACKKRREKCDETKPICSGCTKHSTGCTFTFLRPSLPTNRDPSNNAPSTLSSPSPNRLSSSKYTNLVQGIYTEEDLRLFHHFVTSMDDISGGDPGNRSGLHTQISRQALEIAYEYPFLMHGLLSISAIHLGHLQPHLEQQYLLSATRYQCLALPTYRSLLNNMDKENYKAVIAFSKGITWTSIAAPTIWPPAGPSEGSAHNWLPISFTFMRASSLLVQDAMEWMGDDQNPFTLLFGLHKRPLKRIDHPDDVHILNLISMLPLTATPDDDIDDLRINMDAALRLRDAFFMVVNPVVSFAVRYAASDWLSGLPQNFVDMLLQCNPRTLIITAHFCALTVKGENAWFLKGNSYRLLASVMDRLDPQWHRLVEWPCQQVGYVMTWHD